MTTDLRRRVMTAEEFWAQPKDASPDWMIARRHYTHQTASGFSEFSLPSG